MKRKYLRIFEVTEICGVEENFILLLEQEQLIRPVIHRKEKAYPIDQVDRVRVAHLLMEEMRVNLEGVEVALHMRDQMIAMQHQFDNVLRSLMEELKK
jgi:DNA-binding transcriptional MerR regulator